MDEDESVRHAFPRSTYQTSVAFLGPTATYTHQAALSYFGDSKTIDKKYTLLPSPTISSVFHAVRVCDATYGVVPYENSTNGVVTATLDLLADNDKDNEQAVSRDLVVIGEVFVPVHHCLLGRKSTSQPEQQEPQEQSSSTSLLPSTSTSSSPSNPYAHIKTLYSHPQAWGQCTEFLTQYLSHATRHDCTSTSRAAELAAEDPTNTSAAVSNILAAEANGLDILAKNIVDDPEGNETRFLILRRKRPRHEDDSQQQQQPLQTAQTTTLFTVIPRRPTMAFRDAGIIPILSLLANKSARAEIAKVHSRPRPATPGITTGRGRKPWEYVYLVEVFRLGDRMRDNGLEGDDDSEHDDYLNRLLSLRGDLAKLVQSVRCMGVWEDRLVVLEDLPP